MMKTSFINPFSNDAKEIVRKLGNIEYLDKKDDDLVNIITHTPSQQLGIDAQIPDTLLKLALKRFEWYLYKKLEDFNEKKYEYLFNPDIYEYDVVSFYLLCQALAIVYGSQSHEVKQLIDSEKELISQRLEKIKAEPTDVQSNFFFLLQYDFALTNFPNNVFILFFPWSK